MKRALIIIVLLAAYSVLATNISDTLESLGNYKVFSEALETTGIIDILRGEGPFTVFVPTDEAFAKLSDNAPGLVANVDVLRDILLYHIVPGHFNSYEIASIGILDTLYGEIVKINLFDDLLIHGSRVILKDIEVSNGIIHIVESVIVPLDECL